jgi:DNA-binding MarR family transcriptional regulator
MTSTRRQRASDTRDSVDRLAADWESSVPSFPTHALHVFNRIQRIAKIFEDALSAAVKRHGLVAGDEYVLLALRRAPHRLNPRELLKELSVTASAVTKRVDRLAAAGFVERSPDTADGRGVKIGLTERGRQLVDDDILFSEHFSFTTVEGLSTDECAMLTSLLRQVLLVYEGALGPRVGPKGALRR